MTTWVFKADEGNPSQSDISTPVPIFDDTVNEACSQFFVVQLQLLDATNRNLVNIGRDFSHCTINDNDREPRPIPV